jgi:outer membrane lipase/esterase
MRTHFRRIPVFLLSALTLVLGSWGPAQGQSGLLDLATEVPGLSRSQAAVAAAIDFICPKLNPTNAAQQDLLTQCSAMKGKGELGRVALGRSQLRDILGKVTSEQTSSQGTGAIETRAAQFQAIGARLDALRLGATGLKLGGLGFDLGGRTASAAPLDLGETGGGASADALGGRLGAFVNGVGSFGSKDATDRETGFNFHTMGVTVGVDYRLAENLVAGAAFSYLRSESVMNVALGDVDSNSYGMSLYGTYYVGPVYVDVLSGFTWHDYSIARRIVYAPGPDGSGSAADAVDRTAEGDTIGRQFTLNVGAGYNFRQGGFTLTPYARMEFLNLHINGYTESGANGLDLHIKKQTEESLLTVLGGRLAYALSAPFGVLVPAVHGEWRHEFLNDQRSIRAQFANDPFNTVFRIPTDDPDRDYFAVGAGVSAAFAKGAAAFLEFETVLGLRSVTNHNFTAGVRFEF